MILLYGGAARAVDEDGETHDFGQWRQLPVREVDDGLPIIGGELRVPRVLHLQRYDRAPRVAVRLTRRNLMLRDQHQCQYCARRPSLRDLNVDHVIPRSRGGNDSWENLVVSCRELQPEKGPAHPGRSRHVVCSGHRRSPAGRPPRTSCSRRASPISSGSRSSRPAELLQLAVMATLGAAAA